MLALGIDTSSPAGSVGLIDGDEFCAELNHRSGVTHSGRLLPAIQSLFDVSGADQEQLGVIAVASGPGSFTGLRIGMATARGLGVATGKPVVGFSTLESIAIACVRNSGLMEKASVCVLLNAGRGEVYRGLFSRKGDEVAQLVPDAALSPEAAVDALPEGTLVCGEGATRFRETIEGLLPSGSILLSNSPPIGITLAQRGADLVKGTDPSNLPPLEPNYLRIPDAERNFKG